jgi:hypothetical protein
MPLPLKPLPLMTACSYRCAAVITMREPISQAIAMLNHQLDHKRM